MARCARVVVPGCPHHVTQRGNCQQDVFFSDRDRGMYLDILRDQCSRHELAVLGYCLMSNHVHLIAVPAEPAALAKALGRTHNEYARWLHVRERRVGHLWQNRFYSCPLEARRLPQALHYVESNPVRADLADAACDWSWSSARAHVSGHDERALLDMRWWSGFDAAERWREVLELGFEEAAWLDRLREATRTGRPWGGREFTQTLERQLGRALRPRRPGRKPRPAAEPGQLQLGIA